MLLQILVSALFGCAYAVIAVAASIALCATRDELRAGYIALLTIASLTIGAVAFWSGVMSAVSPLPLCASTALSMYVTWIALMHCWGLPALKNIQEQKFKTVQ